MSDIRFRGKRNGTHTSSFGSPGRINHDSTSFYASKLYESLPKEKVYEYTENPIPDGFLNRVFCRTSEISRFNSKPPVNKLFATENLLCVEVRFLTHRHT